MIKVILLPILVFISVLLLGVRSYTYIEHRQPVVIKPVAVVQAVVAPLPPNVGELFTDVNNERVKAGETPLILDSRLVASATAKCADMVRLNEWDHNLSDGTTPWTFIQAQFTHYHTAAENLTWGWTTSQMVTDKWMASPGHRANILNPVNTLVGYATCSSPKYPLMVVQHFVGY